MSDNVMTTPDQDDVLNRLNALLNRDKVEAATRPLDEPSSAPEKEIPLLVDIVEYGQVSAVGVERNDAHTQEVSPDTLQEMTDLVQDAIVDYLRPTLESAVRQALVDLRPRLEDLVRQSLLNGKRPG